MKVTKKIFFIFLCFVGMALNMHAQNVEVIGKVTDDTGEELVGATVSQAGTVHATMTDHEGNYKLSVPQDSKLTFAFIGNKPQTIALEGRKIINVVLESAYTELNEVVAIGYGTVKRSELTSAVSSIKGSDLEDIPVTSAIQALTGKVAGLQISQAQGSPDASIKVRIRGGISIGGDDDPLYIVDGFPSPEGLSILDPSDIESIDVLKDASATAIYGAAGANGVILITTKTGKEGRSNITFDAYVGFKKISKKMNVLNSLDFVKLEYERAAILNLDDRRKFTTLYGLGWDDSLSDLENMTATWRDMPGVYSNRKGVDWQDEVFNSDTPLSQNYKIGINGGNKETKYNLSFAHNSDDGVLKGSGFDRNNIRIRLDQKINEKLKVSVTSNFVEENTKGLGSLNENGVFSRMRQIIQYRPIISRDGNDRDLITMNVDPELDNDSGNVMINPLTAIREEQRKRKNQVFNVNASVTYKILKNLTYQGQVGMRRRWLKNDQFFHTYSNQAKRNGGPYADLSNNEDDSWNYTNTLSYAVKLPKKHKLDIMVGQEESYSRTKWMKQSIMQFPEDNLGLNNLGLGGIAKMPSNNISDRRKLSFFGRAQYNLMSKYMLTATLRGDGSSVFGLDEKWGLFPSASIAWRAVDEKFIKDLDIFSDLKVRVGYGTAGNDRISEYLSIYNMIPGITAENNLEENSVVSGHLPNPGLKWETDVSTNIGIDAGFFNQRLQVSVDMYLNSATDLLLNRNMSHILGIPNSRMVQNIGKTENRGIEIAISSYNIDTKDFKWNTNFNIAFNKNKVKKLADSSTMPWQSGWAPSSEFNSDDYMIREGDPLGQMWGWKSNGIHQVDEFKYENGKYSLKDPSTGRAGAQPGDWKMVDTNKDGIVDSRDKKVIGTASPLFHGGITNNFKYKSFDVGVIFTYSVGGDVYNANKMFYTKTSHYKKNALDVVKDRFTHINEHGENVFNNPTELGRINKGKNWASVAGSNNMEFHSKYVESASFLKLSNITIGYTIPKKILKNAGISNLRVYASANNLFTITGYSGFDPEVDTKPNGGLTPGVDWGSYPRAITGIVGVNLSF